MFHFWWLIGALHPSKSGLPVPVMNKHIVKHIVPVLHIVKPKLVAAPELRV